jgi:hypothetical protein
MYIVVFIGIARWDVVAITSLVVLLVVFFDILAGFSLCCHPNREDKNKNFSAPSYTSGGYTAAAH